MLLVLGTGSWFLLLYSVFSLERATGLETNRTIDDKFGDSVTGQKPIFLPTTPGIWDGETCTGCRFQPDKAVAFKGTWQAATFRPEEGGSGPLSIDLSFKGTAIYVYFITGNQIAGGIITTLMECNFTLDGDHAGFFQHIPDKSENFQYNVLAFNRTGLLNKDHTVKVTTEGVGYHLLLNFDYAIYTFDDASDASTTLPPTSSALPPPALGSPPDIASPNKGSENRNGPPLGAIIGGTLGGLTLVLGLILLFYIYHDRKRRRKPPELPLHTDATLQHTPTPATKNPSQGSGRFTRILYTKFSTNYDRKSPRRSINAIDSQNQPEYLPPENTSPSDNSNMEINTTLRNQPSRSSESIDAARRARQLQLENQLRSAEEELREMGVEPRRGLPGPELSAGVLQTSLYIEYRRLQREMEEPPPQYSE